MATFDYASFVLEVDAILAEFGQTASIIQSPTGDASQPWDAATGTEVSTNVTAVLLEYDHREIDGEQVKEGDVKALIAPAETAGIAAEDMNFLVVGSERWRVVHAKPLNPAGVRLLVEVQLRR